MDNSPNNVAILTNVLAEPQKAFKDIQTDYPILVPLVSFLLIMASVIVIYYAMVDYDWYIEQNVEMLAGDKSKSDQDTVRAQMTLLEPMTQGLIGAIVMVIGYLIFFAVYSSYFVICSNIADDGFDFKQWLSFIAWAWVPKSVLLLVGVLIIFISDNGQISQDALNPTSLNSLFFGLNPTSGMGALLSNIDLGTIWTIALMIIGYKTWTNASTTKSISIILFPYVLVFGIWALIAA